MKQLATIGFFLVSPLLVSGVRAETNTPPPNLQDYSKSRGLPNPSNSTPPGVYKSEPHTAVVVVPKQQDTPAIKKAEPNAANSKVKKPDLKLIPRGNAQTDVSEEDGKDKKHSAP
jgi:hypothetical protein